MSKVWIHKSQVFTKNGESMTCEGTAEKGTIDRGWWEGMSSMLRNGWMPTGEIKEVEVIQHYGLPKLTGRSN